MTPGETQFIPPWESGIASAACTLFGLQPQQLSPGERTLPSPGDTPTLPDLAEGLLGIGAKLLAINAAASSLSSSLSSSTAAPSNPAAQTANNIGTPKSLKKLILACFADFEHQGQSAGKSKEAVSAAKYALAAFLDESVLALGGSFHEFWVQGPLSVEFFSDPIVGQNFFIRLESLLQQLHLHHRSNKENKDKSVIEVIEIIEIFTLCLVLGFRGRYRLSKQEKLPIIIDNLMRHIETVRGKAPKCISPSANIPAGLKARKNPAGRWIAAGVSLLGLAAAYYFTLTLFGANGLKPASAALESIESSFYRR